MKYKTQNIPRFNLYGENSQFPDIVHFEHIKDRASEYAWVISPHRHPQMSQLIFIKQGSVEVNVDGKQFTMGDNSLIYIPAEAVHGFSFAPNTEGSVVSFPLLIVNELNQAKAGVLASLSELIIAPMTSTIAQLLDFLELEYVNSSPHHILVKLGLAYSVLAKIADLSEQNSLEMKAIPTSYLAKLDRLIVENMGRGLCPSEYAELLSITTGHLSRICRDEKGSSASVYIETMIMTEAARLLAFTQQSISQVAYQVGFNDPSYFSRRFRLIQGLTPSQYKKRFVSS